MSRGHRLISLGASYCKVQTRNLHLVNSYSEPMITKPSSKTMFLIFSGFYDFLLPILITSRSKSNSQPCCPVQINGPARASHKPISSKRQYWPKFYCVQGRPWAASQKFAALKLASSLGRKWLIHMNQPTLMKQIMWHKAIFTCLIDKRIKGANL